MQFDQWSLFALSLRPSPPPVDPAEARRVALVIGNGAYEHTRVLPNARNDARVIAALLAKIGFVVSEASDLAYPVGGERLMQTHFGGSGFSNVVTGYTLKSFTLAR